MHGIFSRSGVHAAVKHDNIVNGKRAIRSDPRIIEAEARKVAAEAAAELRKAEETARSTPIGIPTWTGQFGIGGRSDFASGSSARPAGAGPLSVSLISRLNPSASVGGASSPVVSALMPRGKDFIPMIRDFLLSRRVPVLSQTIVHHFNHYCPNEQRVRDFQETLKIVADLSKDRYDRGVWALKPEFNKKTS